MKFTPCSLPSDHFKLSCSFAYFSVRGQEQWSWHLVFTSFAKVDSHCCQCKLVLLPLPSSDKPSMAEVDYSRRSHRPSPSPRAVAAGAAAGTSKPKNAAEAQRAQLEKLFVDPSKEVYIPAAPKAKTLAPPRDMIPNVQGSSAGAGAFWTNFQQPEGPRKTDDGLAANFYRLWRIPRLQAITEEGVRAFKTDGGRGFKGLVCFLAAWTWANSKCADEQEKAEREFAGKQRSRQEADDARTAKNRAKRLKKKAKKGSKKGKEAATDAHAGTSRKDDGRAGDGDSDSDSDSSDSDDGFDRQKKRKIMSGAPGAVLFRGKDEREQVDDQPREEEVRAKRIEEAVYDQGSPAPHNGISIVDDD